jgi:hypothetical protein
LWLICDAPYIADPATRASGTIAWPPAYVVTEMTCPFRILLVPASDQWERAKDILSWIVVGGVIAIIAIAVVAFSK